MRHPTIIGLKRHHGVRTFPKGRRCIIEEIEINSDWRKHYPQSIATLIPHFPTIFFFRAEEAMREAFNVEMATVARGDKSLLQLCAANDVLTGQIRDRDRQIAELRSRLIENAEQARADRIGWAA